MADPCDFVIFGGTGDLAVRTLLPALYLRDRDGQLTADTRIIAVARGPRRAWRTCGTPTPRCPPPGSSHRRNHPTNVAEYLKAPNVGCVGGSWLTPTDAIGRHDWAKISGLATVALELANPKMRKAESQ
ncbi:MAG TPA: hypothetical protein VKA77_17890 [Mycobacterium sp.]|jgi:hypothetical protein|nr:hypothetical protein [Mycobacterium sp.]